MDFSWWLQSLLFIGFTFFCVKKGDDEKWPAGAGLVLWLIGLASIGVIDYYSKLAS
tara:strand:- start:55 stop:222 length:168 start_codon:yes stop_codon:yes gene_type:complete